MGCNFFFFFANSSRKNPKANNYHAFGICYFETEMWEMNFRAVVPKLLQGIGRAYNNPGDVEAMEEVL